MKQRKMMLRIGYLLYRIPTTVWPDNHTTGVTLQFCYHFNDATLGDTMVACLFMISNVSHYVQTYPLDSYLLGTCHDTTINYLATS